ncbi:MAG TPA: hypothetical protein PKH24_06255 [Sedimentisphaerales bacterium]|nr:hypothetical protein [Sedimentisphaerales bacterium]HNU27842.1 hypothetical protein [Sedimentisphaerales bacterium]
MERERKLLLADGKIYVPNQSGDVFVFRAAPQFELLATNSVGEGLRISEIMYHNIL